MNKAVRD